MYHGTYVEVRGQLCRVDALLPLQEIQGLDLGHWAILLAQILVILELYPFFNAHDRFFQTMAPCDSPLLIGRNFWGLNINSSTVYKNSQQIQLRLDMKLSLQRDHILTVWSVAGRYERFGLINDQFAYRFITNKLLKGHRNYGKWGSLRLPLKVMLFPAPYFVCLSAFGLHEMNSVFFHIQRPAGWGISP